MLELIPAGLGGHEVALTTARVATGTFFALSGGNKLFVACRHLALVRTLQDDGIPLVRVNQWFVPSVEFMGGLALVVGLATPVAALGLLVICIVACVVDAPRRISAMKPINRADWLDDWLYLPELIYALLLLVFVSGGGGQWSLDHLIWTALH